MTPTKHGSHSQSFETKRVHPAPKPQTGNAYKSRTPSKAPMKK